MKRLALIIVAAAAICLMHSSCSPKTYTGYTVHASGKVKKKKFKARKDCLKKQRKIRKRQRRRS